MTRREPNGTTLSWTSRKRFEVFALRAFLVFRLFLGTTAFYAAALTETSQVASPSSTAQVVENQEKTPSEKVGVVLIDARHALDFSNAPILPSDFNYHRIYSFRRAFEYLKTRGVDVRRFDGTEPLDAETLAECDVLFLNLPSGDQEPFLISEIVAIKEFIENGGSAFFIVDHTNCYFHASRLRPLFHELEIVPQTVGVCDASHNLGEGFGWIYFNDFEQHPVTQGLRRVAFQTGGAVDPRWAVAWSSEHSWADAAIIPLYGEADLAYSGNFVPEKGEFVGRQGVVLAKNFGRGKIIVVGDQNLFSNFFLNYLDNYRLWLNSFAWLLDRSEVADVDAYRREAAKNPTVLCWEELAQTGDSRRFGNPDPSGFYHLYAYLNRRYNVVAVADSESANEWSANVALFIGGGNNMSDDAVNFAVELLKAGKTAIVLDPTNDVLSDEKSFVFKVCKDLANEDERLREPKLEKEDFLTRRKYQNGARLTLINGENRSFDNSSVTRPERPLLMQPKLNLDPLIYEISNVLDGGKNDASEKPTQP